MLYSYLEKDVQFPAFIYGDSCLFIVSFIIALKARNIKIYKVKYIFS